MIEQSPQFLDLSRTFELAADTMLPFMGASWARDCETVLREKIITNGPNSNSDDKLSTHPSWEKRLEWVRKIRKLLEAEERFLNQNHKA